MMLSRQAENLLLKFLNFWKIQIKKGYFKPFYFLPAIPATTTIVKTTITRTAVIT